MRWAFAVDSRLLRELGARLVGRPHIALAELVKNAYDADASEVVITILRDRIIIADDGHGMTADEFRDRWMRIGTADKETQGTSRLLGRPLTGSKGVGRLAVQLLASELRLDSVSVATPDKALRAAVDWDEAVNAGLLTRAEADVDDRADPSSVELPGGSDHGTRIELTRLQQRWSTRALRDLAREIWPLRPPFEAVRSEEAFRVVLNTGNREQEAEFEQQMQAVLGLWTARLVGRMLPDDQEPSGPVVDVLRPGTKARADADGADQADRLVAVAADGDLPNDASDLLAPAPEDAPGRPRTVQLALQFNDGSPEVLHYRLLDCALDMMSFEIRVFNLRNRQPSGITVGQAREYLRRFGGVHVYDAGFHLPNYGPDTDWLHVEIDHSHRLSVSALLPSELTLGSRAASPLQYLPTNSRLFGAVRIDTSHEGRAAREISPAAAREALSIQVTRDRLAETQGYRSLVQLTRFALDLYAIREAQRAYERKFGAIIDKQPDDPYEDDADRGDGPELTADERTDLIRELIDDASDALPEETVRLLSDQLHAVADQARREREASEARVGLLGALATAGITALAYEHEAAKQNALLARQVRRLRRPGLRPQDVADVAEQIEAVLRRSSAIRRMFSHLLDARTRDSQGTFLAAAVAADVAEQVRPLLHGVEISTAGVPEDLRLAFGGYAEWAAALQNIYLNAANATLDAQVRRIYVDGSVDGRYAWLRIQDTGGGVDLDAADRLFLPFERRQGISQERAALGLGGTGLGLTIVRMLATDMDVSVQFEPPDSDYSTAIAFRWRTK